MSSATDIPYTARRAKKGVGGLVSYNCPRCGESLESKLEEAGMADQCPRCDTTFTVPGAAELQQQRDAEQARLAQGALRSAEANRLENERRTREEALRIAQRHKAVEESPARQPVGLPAFSGAAIASTLLFWFAMGGYLTALVMWVLVIRDITDPSGVPARQAAISIVTAAVATASAASVHGLSELVRMVRSIAITVATPK